MLQHGNKMPNYIKFDDVRAQLDFSPVIDFPCEGSDWECVDASCPKRIQVMFRRYVRGPESPSRFLARPSPTDDPKAPVLIFATNDESTMGRCFTVQTGRVYVRSPTRFQVSVTIADSRLDAKRLGRVIQECNDLSCIPVPRVRQHRIHVELYTIISGWPDDPPARLPNLQSLFRSCRGPVTDISPQLASINGIKNAALVAYGRAVVATIDAKLAQRLDDSEASWSACDPLLECIRCKIAKIAKLQDDYKIVLVCQTSTAKADCMYAEQTTALIGVPMASVAVAFETLYLSDEDEFFDCDNVVSREDIEAESHLRTERAEAAIAIRQVIKRPEVINNIKRRIWRPDGKLVKDMIARDTAAARAIGNVGPQ